MVDTLFGDTGIDCVVACLQLATETLRAVLSQATPTGPSAAGEEAACAPGSATVASGSSRPDTCPEFAEELLLGAAAAIEIAFSRDKACVSVACIASCCNRGSSLCGGQKFDTSSTAQDACLSPVSDLIRWAARS